MPRLDHLLARNLALPRSAARRLIAEGQVTDRAGRPLEDARWNIDGDELPLAVQVEGQAQELHDEVDLVLNKPTGFVTALRDDRHPVAYQLLQDAPLATELRPVGRLDLDTSGLLLWTTSGPWLQHLTHPKRAYPRRYQAALARPLQDFPPGTVPELVLDDGHRPIIRELCELAAGQEHPALAVHPETAALVSITIVGGAYHEVRRIFAALGSHVLALCRVAYGALELPVDLPAGSYRPIRREDV